MFDQISIRKVPRAIYTSKLRFRNSLGYVRRDGRDSAGCKLILIKIRRVREFLRARDLFDVGEINKVGK